MKSIGISSIFIWIGFLLAISFLEAWLKFQAPGVTLSIGLGIGQLVFNALNKVEWILSLSCILSVICNNSLANGIKLLIIVPILLVLIQTFWLLPALDIRAIKIIQGEFVPKNNLHYYYVISEIIKLIFLIASGSRLLKNFINK